MEKLMNSEINKLGRRNFIKKGMAGFATLTVGPSILHGSLLTEEKKNPKIVTRKLGNTGLELPVISMGVMNADNPNLLRAAHDKGIVHFDTISGCPLDSYHHVPSSQGTATSSMVTDSVRTSGLN